jgi:hypothetical protein
VLLLFLAEGLEVAYAAGMLLVAVSIGIQALGAFSYDGPHPSGKSPLLRAAHERVLIFTAPVLAGGKLVLRRHPVVLRGPVGSSVGFMGGTVNVEGTPETMRDIHLQGDARFDGEGAVLRGETAAIFMRLVSGARAATLGLHIEGIGRGTLVVEEQSFWADSPRRTSYPISGTFQVQHPYFYPKSGGGDLLVRVSAGSEALVRSLKLVPPATKLVEPTRP